MAPTVKVTIRQEVFVCVCVCVYIYIYMRTGNQAYPNLWSPWFFKLLAKTG